MSQSSNTWKKAFGNFCTPASSVFTSQKEKLYRGWEIMCTCMPHTQNRTFFNVNIKKIKHKHWDWLSLVLHVKFIRKPYIHVIYFFILCKAKLMSLHREMIIKMITEWKYFENKKASEKPSFLNFYLLLGYPTANFDPLMREQPH